jgi:hypothetical protein
MQPLPFTTTIPYSSGQPVYAIVVSANNHDQDKEREHEDEHHREDRERQDNHQERQDNQAGHQGEHDQEQEEEDEEKSDKYKSMRACLTHLKAHHHVARQKYDAGPHQFMSKGACLLYIKTVQHGRQGEQHKDSRIRDTGSCLPTVRFSLREQGGLYVTVAYIL